MSTGTEIIQEALERIGAHSIVMSAEADSIVKGKNALNSMLQLWISWGIDIQTVPLNAPGDELSEPIDAREAIIDNLAIKIAPMFDNGETIVSPDLRANARLGFKMVKTLYQRITISKTKPSSLLPRGAGNSKGNESPVFIGTAEGDGLLDA